MFWLTRTKKLTLITIVKPRSDAKKYESLITVKVDGLLFLFPSKIVELEEELRVVGNNLKSLEVSEEKVYICDFIRF